jgi:hypothetical protein
MNLSQKEVGKIFSELLRSLPIEKDANLEDIYEENCVEDLLENDSISAAEAGFMMGYYED